MAYNADFAPASSTPTLRLSFCPDCAEEQNEPEDDGTCPICAAILEAPPPLPPPPHSSNALGSIASSAANSTPNPAVGSSSSTGSAASAAGPLASAEQMAAIQALMPGQGDDSDLALAMELSLAQASSNSSGRAASTTAIAELPRYTIEDDRCSALHEIVLEVGLQIEPGGVDDASANSPSSDFTSSSSSTSHDNASNNSDRSGIQCAKVLPHLMPERYNFETEMAAFSPLPPPEWQASGSQSLPLPSMPLVWGLPEEGNAPFDNAEAMNGSVVVLRRGGGATFAAKALRAQAAGALAVVRLTSYA